MHSKFKFPTSKYIIHNKQSIIHNSNRNFRHVKRTPRKFLNIHDTYVTRQTGTSAFDKDNTQPRQGYIPWPFDNQGLSVPRFAVINPERSSRNIRTDVMADRQTTPRFHYSHGRKPMSHSFRYARSLLNILVLLCYIL